MRLFLIAVILSSAMIGNSADCYVSFCPNIRCLDRSVCGQGCVCLRIGLETMGRCASLN